MRRRAFIGSLACSGLLSAASIQPLQARSAAGFDPLLYVDPELRPSARDLLQNRLTLSTEALPRLRSQGAATAEPPLQNVPFEMRRIDSAPGMLPVTIYLVNAGRDGSRPAILHMHGGGHVLGSARSELSYLQAMAAELDCVLVTVNYRLAPETRYSGSVADNYAALRWLHASSAELGVDPERIVLLGESAGGTHAALLAIEARNRGEVPIAFQALVYPMLDDRTGSTRDLPEWIGAVLWDRSANRFGWEAFTGSRPGSADVPSRAVPARVEDLPGLPPAWIGVGGVDLFVAENIEYARRLTEAGVPTELLVVPRAYHAFDRIAPHTEIARRFTSAKMGALFRALYPEQPQAVAETAASACPTCVP